MLNSCARKGLLVFSSPHILVSQYSCVLTVTVRKSASHALRILRGAALPLETTSLFSTFAPRRGTNGFGLVTVLVAAAG